LYVNSTPPNPKVPYMTSQRRLCSQKTTVWLHFSGFMV
jgi:hypothetical protein